MENVHEKTVLVVEDEPDVQLVLVTALQDAGFQVVTASDGHEAYNRVKERMPDFITLDLVMPRQSGVLFYKKLRKNSRWQKIPVMIVTAHARDDLGQEDFQELMYGENVQAPDDYMEKPVDTYELVRKVSEKLGVDTSEFLDRNAEENRENLLTKLRNVDLSTLDKIREVLEKQS